MGHRQLAPVAGLALLAAALVGAHDRVPLLWPHQVGGVKAGVAMLATGLLVFGLWRDRGGAREPRPRLRDAALAALGVLGLVCWTNLFQWNYPGFGHPSDTFHYYLGAKYFPELRYTRLYDCVAVADAEAGLDQPRPLRDLTTNTLTTSRAALADPERCRTHFDPARWDEFRHDVAFFRSHVLPGRWLRFQQDHGYNATPAWGVLGHWLTNTGPASDAQIAALRTLDPLLIALLFAAIASAFGWRIACVAAIWFGTNYVSPYGWTGGSILRQDWLAATVIGICALRRGRFATAGALLALAALLRIFPVLVLGGVALGTLGRMLRTRSLSLLPEERRFAAGALATTALVVPLSVLALGPSAWSQFLDDSRLHLSTPLENDVGLRTVLSYDTKMRTELARDATLADPMGPWKDARRAHFARFALLYVALVIGFAGLIARAAASRPLWVAAVLGVAWIPVGVELTAYYWSVLLALALLMERHPSMGPALCGLSALGWGISETWHWTDQIHVWLSVVTVAFSVFTVLLATPRSITARR